jgi:hypothetical protein
VMRKWYLGQTWMGRLAGPAWWVAVHRSFIYFFLLFLLFLFLFFYFVALNSYFDFQSVLQGFELRCSFEIDSGYKVKHFITSIRILCVLTHKK